MATKRARGQAFKACVAAPVPRPPQPIKAKRIELSLDAWALRAREIPPMVTAPAATDDDKNSRRDEVACGDVEREGCMSNSSIGG
jgi:hypothetical protein